MQAALQLRAQRPHPLHLLVSMTGFSHENRDTNPKMVPTGQMVLHQVRPLRHANILIINKVEIAMPNVIVLLIQTSVS